MTDETAPQAPVDPLVAMQELLAKLAPDSMVLGFVTTVEWLDADGDHAMSVLHTKMSPWHMHGLMSFARDYHGCSGGGVAYVLEDDED